MEDQQHIETRSSNIQDAKEHVRREEHELKLRTKELESTRKSTMQEMAIQMTRCREGNAELERIKLGKYW